MDNNESYTRDTREDDSPYEARSSGLGLSRVTSAPDPGRPGIYRPYDARHPVFKSSTTLRGPHLPADSLTSDLRWAAPAPTPLDTLAERPEKRPRLDQKLDTGLGKSFRRIRSPEVGACVLLILFILCAANKGDTERLSFRCWPQSLAHIGYSLRAFLRRFRA